MGFALGFSSTGRSDCLDNLSRTQRSLCMARVRTHRTDIEEAVAVALAKRQLRFSRNCRDLPGSPDIVFRRARVAVFVHGDFWHGWRLTAWKPKPKKFWLEKLKKNRIRDRAVCKKLQRTGWKVVRIWQHQIQRDLDGCADRVQASLTWASCV